MTKEKPLNEKVMKFEVVKPTLFWYKAKDVAQAVDRLKSCLSDVEYAEAQIDKIFGELK